MGWLITSFKSNSAATRFHFCVEAIYGNSDSPVAGARKMSLDSVTRYVGFSHGDRITLEHLLTILPAFQ
jgi:hypothetical protein